MALGNSNYSGGNNQRQESSFYSRLKFLERGDSGKSVRIKYWKGMMCISISKGGESENGYKLDDLATIYLSPLKAKMLADALEEFISDKKHAPIGVNVGITETQTCIVFWHNDDGSITMAISKIDGTGKKESEQTFVFASDYDYYLEFKDYTKMKFEKHNVEDIQISSIINALREYFNGICGGIAYSVMDYARFDISRTTTRLNAIMDKLGIQRQSSFSGGGGENSYFNKQGAAPQSSTYSDHHDAEDLDDLIS